MISKFLSLKCKQATESLRMLSSALQWTLAHLRNLNASDDLHGESFDSYVSTCAKFAVDKRASFVWPFSNNLICFMIYNFIQLHNPVTGFAKWILHKANLLESAESSGFTRFATLNLVERFDRMTVRVPKLPISGTLNIRTKYTKCTNKLSLSHWLKPQCNTLQNSNRSG